MRTRTTTALITAGLLATLTACADHPRADPAACREALAEAFADAMETGATGKAPAACDRVEEPTRTKLAGEILFDYVQTEEGHEALKGQTSEEFERLVRGGFDGLGATPAP
ncbi:MULTISPECIES: hypothetical protein [unclassified Streptomyces]|uniref:hypothetical protein n=1 Tax=unclassified Streptomyces TaxID=2593676 RepID=UPI002E28E80A|nr:hypothetical protein [Streptomyces sp. NBC_01429]